MHYSDCVYLSVITTKIETNFVRESFPIIKQRPTELGPIDEAILMFWAQSFRVAHVPSAFCLNTWTGSALDILCLFLVSYGRQRTKPTQ